MFALYSSVGRDSRETSVFVFHYLLVVMAIVRKWRVARGPSEYLFNEPSLERHSPGFSGNGKCGKKLQVGGTSSRKEG